jgi:hypothetical protein
LVEARSAAIYSAADVRDRTRRAPRRQIPLRRALGRGLAALALALAASAPGSAEEGAAGGADALTRSLFLREHVEEWPELTVAVRDEVRSRLPAQAWELLRRETHRRHAPDALLARVRERLGRSLADSDAAALLSLVAGAQASGLAAERAARTQGGLLEQPAFLASVLADAPSEQRRRWVARWDEATGLSRDVLETAASVAESLAAGMWALRCGGTPRPELLERARAKVLRYREPVETRVRAARLFAYRGLSLVELADYVRAVESEPSRRLYAALGHQLREALAETRAQLAADLAPAVAERCAAP